MFNDEKLPLAVKFVDANGNDAPVDGVPVWISTSDASVLTMNVAADGMSAFAVSVDGAQGVATVTVTADAHIGAGVTNISGSLDVAVMNRPLEAVGVQLTAGTPEPK